MTVAHPHSDDAPHPPTGARWLNAKAYLIVGVVLAALLCEAAIVTLLMPSRAEIERAERESVRKRGGIGVARRPLGPQEQR
jgi:hypothetical protein